MPPLPDESTKKISLDVCQTAVSRVTEEILNWVAKGGCLTDKQVKIRIEDIEQGHYEFSDGKLLKATIFCTLTYSTQLGGWV